ncbi:MAG: hypothetical protein AAGH92_06575 [Planctomycetota bacterium]
MPDTLTELYAWLIGLAMSAACVLMVVANFVHAHQRERFARERA